MFRLVLQVLNRDRLCDEGGLRWGEVKELPRETIARATALSNMLMWYRRRGSEPTEIEVMLLDELLSDLLALAAINIVGKDARVPRGLEPLLNTGQLQVIREGPEQGLSQMVVHGHDGPRAVVYDRMGQPYWSKSEVPPHPFTPEYWGAKTPAKR